MPRMLDDFRALAGDAVLARATLVANHVIGAEPAAMERLRPHAGRRIEVVFEGWPALLPPLPRMAFSVTPAGLLEHGSEEADAALRVVVDASNPARMALQALAGERPQVTIAGDAAFAGDIQWLVDNLRWDVQDDLERVVGAGPAREIARIAGAAADALRRGVQTLAGFAAPRQPR